MLRFTILSVFLFFTLLPGCGGGGGATSGTTIPTSEATSEAKALTATQSGEIFEFTLDNGNIVFAAYNRGEVLKVSSDGGEITTLYSKTSTSPGKIVSANGKVFILNTQTSGGVLSIPENSIGVSTLARDSVGGTLSQDISCDGKYVYWSIGSNVYRTPLIVTTKTVETLFTGSNGGTVRMALDGDHLYITDTESRKLYLLSTSTLVKSELLSFSETPSGGTFYFGIPVTFDKDHIYALVDNRNIHRINKSNPQDAIAASNYMTFHNVKIAADKTGMYWWENSPNGTDLFLKKIDTLSGSSKILLTIPFTWNLDAFFSDGTNLYWFEHELNSTGDYVYKIKRVSINGGNSELVSNYTSDININGALLPSAVTFDTNNIYWSSNTANLISKLSKSGGVPEIVTRYDTYSAITAIDGYLLASNQGKITKIPINGATPATSEWSVPKMSSSIPKEMTRDDSKLYWTVQNSATATDTWGTFDIYSKPIEGTISQKVATVPGSANRLYPYSDYLFLAKSTSSGGAVSVIQKSGGSEKILISTKEFEPNDLQIVGNTMYLLAEGVHVLNLDTGEVKTLVHQNDTNNIYVDGTYIYWTQSIYGGGGGLYRIPITGGHVQKLYDGASWKVAGDNINIYWATGLQILSLLK